MAHLSGKRRPEAGRGRVKKFTKIYPLSQAANPPKLNFVNVSGRDFNSVGPADYPFWEYLNQVVQEEPTDSVDPTTLGLWASIGIQKGKPFNPDARMKKILTEAALVGDATARAITYRWRTPEGYYYPDTRVHGAWDLSEATSSRRMVRALYPHTQDSSSMPPA